MNLSTPSLPALGVGKARRMQRLLSHQSGRTIVVPFDDGLIFGPFNGLENLPKVTDAIGRSRANAVLAYPGALRATYGRIDRLAWIVNLTASTVGPTHTRKVLANSVEYAARLSADAVAVHVNFTDEHEGEMLEALGHVVEQAETCQIPVVAIMYPRRGVGTNTDNYEELLSNDRAGYARLVAHAVRIGVELGADVIKTQYTGDAESFRKVVDAALGVPVVVAGGPLIDRAAALDVAKAAIHAGARGVSFGRNVYERNDLAEFLSDIADVVHGPITTQHRRS